MRRHDARRAARTLGGTGCGAHFTKVHGLVQQERHAKRFHVVSLDEQRTRLLVISLAQLLNSRLEAVDVPLKRVPHFRDGWLDDRFFHYPVTPSRLLEDREFIGMLGVIVLLSILVSAHPLAMLLEPKLHDAAEVHQHLLDASCQLGRAILQLMPAQAWLHRAKVLELNRLDTCQLGQLHREFYLWPIVTNGSGKLVLVVPRGLEHPLDQLTVKLDNLVDRVSVTAVKPSAVFVGLAVLAQL
mmetsp:Transcript_18578/g.46534  ORF Transcript_18578/g.46534 Transcript_18578/m.46534 type:complete len:242 (+) Transcript_18578:302-1027(+)